MRSCSSCGGRGRVVTSTKPLAEILCRPCSGSGFVKDEPTPAKAEREPSVLDRFVEVAMSRPLTVHEQEALSSSTKKVYAEMRGGQWMTATEIRDAAAADDVDESEGLRRLGELKKFPGVVLESRRCESGREFRILTGASE